jgi:hypothetical protein
LFFDLKCFSIAKKNYETLLLSLFNLSYFNEILNQEVMKKIFLTLLCLPLLTCYSQAPWASVVKSMGFAPLRTPNSELSPGWILRKSDQEPFLTTCFTGTITKANSFSTYKQTKVVSTSVDANLNLGKYGSAVGSFSALKNLMITFEDLRIDEIHDIKENLSDKSCLLPTLTEMIILKSLLSFQKITLTLNVKSGFNVKAKLDSIKTALGNIDGSLGIASNSDNTVEITGTSLYIGYRTFESTNKIKVHKATGTSTRPFTVTGGFGKGYTSKYTITYLANQKTDNLIITCDNRLFLDKDPIKLTISSVGDKIQLSKGGCNVFIQILAVNDKKITVEIIEQATLRAMY